MEEIRHQLIYVVYPTIYRVSTCFNHPFGGAGFRNHPQYENTSDFEGPTLRFLLPKPEPQAFERGNSAAAWAPSDRSQVTFSSSLGMPGRIQPLLTWKRIT